MFTWLLLLILAGTTDNPVWACSAGLRAIQYIIPAIHGPEGRGRPSRDVGSVLCRESGVASGPFGGSSAGSSGGPATISTARFLGLGPSAPVLAPVPASTARAGWWDGGARADRKPPQDREVVDSEAHSAARPRGGAARLAALHDGKASELPERLAQRRHVSRPPAYE